MDPTSLTEHILAHATAVVSEETADYLQQRNLNIQAIFNQRQTKDLSDFSRKKYYILILVADVAEAHRPGCQEWTGCTITIPRHPGSNCDRSWFVSRLREEVEKHFSWHHMMEDELMEDSEFRSEMLRVVVEELGEISSIHVPSTCDQLERNLKRNNRYLTTLWKLSHSFKTTARLAGGLELESQSTVICDILRPVVRGEKTTLNINNETLYTKIREFVASVVLLSFFIRNTILILHKHKK